jgi:predicted nucleic acid-binding protein
VDTSAFLAVIDQDDQNHDKACRQWEALLSGEDALICTNYVVVETAALLQHRFGLEALRTFHEDALPVLAIEWVNEDTHRAAVVRLFLAGRRKLSLVDCVSFEVMHRRGIRSAFTFDKHFKEEGFECAP